MEFHEKLMELRKQQGWSQEQLGNEIGVSRQTISKWELGLTTPELDKLLLLSDLFHITMDELVGREPKPDHDTDYNEGESASDAIHTGRNPHPSPFRKQRGEYLTFVETYYEYKSTRTLFGLPLVHINVSRHGFHHIRRAKGIIAVGDIATGIVALGGFARGIFAFGGLACGLFSLGGAALGLLLAVGGLSIGAVSIGGLAIGLLSVGGLAVGVYAMGGGAVALRIAAGGYASGHIAIGEVVRGEYTFLYNGYDAPPAEAIRKVILEAYPKTWGFLVDLFTVFH